MEKNVLVSVCIPTYNGEKYLEECLESAIGQTYKNIEIIVVDDQSKDKTIAIVKKYAQKDNRIKIFINEKNIGLVENWNKCVDCASGEWIKFLFQDDLLEIDCIEKMLAAADSEAKIIASKRNFLLNEYESASSKKYFFDGVVTFEKIGILNKITKINSRDISNMAASHICLNFIGEPTSILFRKEVVSEIGKFNNNLAQICDLEYFLRIASTYGLVYVPEQLTQFRIHINSTTSLNIAAKKFILSHLDPIILVRQLLYDEQFKNFRNSLNFSNKIKLKNYFLARVHESYKVAKKDNETLDKFNAIATKMPEINSVKMGSIKIKCMHQIVLIRRQLRILFQK